MFVYWLTFNFFWIYLFITSNGFVTFLIWLSFFILVFGNHFKIFHEQSLKRLDQSLCLWIWTELCTGLFYLCFAKTSPFIARGWAEFISLPRTIFGWYNLGVFCLNWDIWTETRFMSIIRSSEWVFGLNRPPLTT